MVYRGSILQHCCVSSLVQVRDCAIAWIQRHILCVFHWVRGQAPWPPPFTGRNNVIGCTKLFNILFLARLTCHFVIHLPQTLSWRRRTCLAWAASFSSLAGIHSPGQSNTTWLLDCLSIANWSIISLILFLIDWSDHGKLTLSKSTFAPQLWWMFTRQCLHLNPCFTWPAFVLNTTCLLIQQDWHYKHMFSGLSLLGTFPCNIWATN